MPLQQSHVVTFRPLRRNDAELIYEWMRRPHVAEWWDCPSSIADLEEQYLPSIGGDATTNAFIAQRYQKPIGFIQAYVVMGSGDGWWESEQDPGARGLDLFLADMDLLGLGLGTAMVRAFLAMTFKHPEVTVVQADPHPSNQGAIRCYAKAGVAM